MIQGSRIQVETDHFQFYLGDQDLAPLVDTATIWEKGRRVGTIEGVPEIAAIGLRHFGGAVLVDVELHEIPEGSSHRGELLGAFDLRVPSGRIIFWGPEAVTLENAPAINVHAGSYRCLAFELTGSDVHGAAADAQEASVLVVLSPSEAGWIRNT